MLQEPAGEPRPDVYSVTLNNQERRIKTHSIAALVVFGLIFGPNTSGCLDGGGSQSHAKCNYIPSGKMHDIEHTSVKTALKIGKKMNAKCFGDAEWPYLHKLWMGESSWKPGNTNPDSGACGIPQAYPCGKITNVPSEIQQTTEGEIYWGLNYITERYGTPHKALGAWNGRMPHWY